MNPKENNPYIGKSLAELKELRSSIKIEQKQNYVDGFNEELADHYRDTLNKIDYAASIAIATQNFGE